MKIASQAFKDALISPDTAVKRAVYYKRRFWQESSKTYIWESDWTLLTEDKIVSVSAINWQLDTQTLNEFKVSNVTLIVKNLVNEWKSDNAYGKFAGDAASPVGYHPYWMKFQIKAGVDFRDTTSELVTLFTGLATDYLQDSRGGSMQITLSGLESLLVNADAERISTTVVNEIVGTGNGTNKDFSLAHTGVGILDNVSINGLTKRPGQDYSISQLNDPVLVGKISFTVAPATSAVVRVTYRYWKVTQKFEDLVVALLNEAGIPTANQQVDPVIFPSKIINRKTFATQADWDAGVKVAIDTSTSVNDIKIDYDDATLARQSTSWMSALDGWLLSAGALQIPTFAPTVQSGTIPAGITVNTVNQTMAQTLTNFTGETVGGSGLSTGYLNIPACPQGVDSVSVRIVPLRSGTITQVNLPFQITCNYLNPRYVTCSLYSESGGAPGSAIATVSGIAVAMSGVLGNIPSITTSFSVTQGVAYWLVVEEDEAANAGGGSPTLVRMNFAAGGWSGGGYCKARSRYHYPVSPTAWQNVENNQSSGPIGNSSGSYTVTPAVVPASSTWTSPTYDVNPYAYGTALTLSATGSYVVGHQTATVYVDGSPDGVTWTNIGGQLNPGGTYSFTASAYRYFRIRVALVTDDDRLTATVNAPSIQFSSSSAVWSAGAHGLTFTPSSGATQTSGWAYRPNFKGAGRWDMDFKEAVVNTDPNTFWFHFMFQSVGSLGVNNFFNGYSVKIELGSTSSTIKLIRNDSAAIGTETELSSASITRDATANHHIHVSRTPLGRFLVFYDGVQKLDVTNLTFTTGNYIGYHIDGQSSEGWELGWYPLYIPPDTITASWTTATMDAGGTPEAWTPLSVTQDLHGGQSSYLTDSSPDGSAWDAFVPVQSNLQIVSTLRRYSQVRVDLTADLLSGQDPVIHSISAGSITSQTVIALANFTGLTVYDAISELAKFANYEWGFTSDEQFFFRSKFVSITPVLTMDQSDFLMSLNSVHGGFDQVYSTVRAIYGAYQTDVTDDAMNLQGPIAQFARQRLEVNGGSILINADADVATGVAASFFNYYKRARRRFNLEAKFQPLLDLSDTVKVSFMDNYPAKLWVLGDASVDLGQLDINLYGASEQILAGALCKLIGVRIDTEKWTNEFDLEEIIL